MAKTFKNLPPAASTAPAKRASERDFFDLTADPQSASTPDVTPAAVPDSDNTDNTFVQGNTGSPMATDSSNAERQTGSAEKRVSVGNTRNTSTTNNTSNPNNMTVSEVPVGTAAPGLSKDVRQTFVLSRNHLEQLRDHVHARRAGGEYTYSQKQALQEALDLLFASAAPVAPRPDQARERERERRERIQQGRLPRT